MSIFLGALVGGHDADALADVLDVAELDQAVGAADDRVDAA